MARGRADVKDVRTSDDDSAAEDAGYAIFNCECGTSVDGEAKNVLKAAREHVAATGHSLFVDCTLTVHYHL